MRHIHLADGMRLRFPNRNAEFDLGVEIGMVAALMEMAEPAFNRRIAVENVEQIRTLAEKMGYRLCQESAEDGWAEVAFNSTRIRPKLKLVHSAP